MRRSNLQISKVHKFGDPMEVEVLARVMRQYNNDGDVTEEAAALGEKVVRVGKHAGRLPPASPVALTPIARLLSSHSLALVTHARLPLCCAPFLALSPPRALFAFLHKSMAAHACICTSFTQAGMMVFPNNPTLLILYANFLLEVRKDGPAARTQLQLASKHSPTLLQRYQVGGGGPARLHKAACARVHSVPLLTRRTKRVDCLPSGLRIT